MFQNDYVMRLIKQVVQAIARMLTLSNEGSYDEAMRQAETAWELLGVPEELTTIVDSATLADMLRHPEKIRAASDLSRQQGDVIKAKRDPITAVSHYRRALELALEARARDPRDEDYETIRELVKRVPQEYLPPEYQARPAD
jgi:hypothetical protein